MSELLRTNDIRFADWASGLTAEEWAASSLCHTWTNHDVLAHLVIGYSGRASALAADMLRDRTSFDGANAELARRLAASRGPQELLDDFVRYRDRPKGMGRYFPRRLLLGDHVTHELDICFALGRRPTIAPCALTAVLDTQSRCPTRSCPRSATAAVCAWRPRTSRGRTERDPRCGARLPSWWPRWATGRQCSDGSRVTASPCSRRA